MARTRPSPDFADAALTALGAGRRVSLTPALLRALVERLDATAAVRPDPRDGVQDRLFAALMARLDGLQRDRAATLALFAQLQGRPELLVAVLPRIAHSIANLLAEAGLATGGWRQQAQVAGLLGVYATTLQAWRRDDSRDLSATMRALDTSLRRALQAGAWLGLYAPLADIVRTGKR